MKKHQAMRALYKLQLTKKDIVQIWKNWTKESFAHLSVERIVENTHWLATLSAMAGEKNVPHVAVWPYHNVYAGSSAKIFAYKPYQTGLFVEEAFVLATQGLSIYEANLAVTKDGYCLHNYCVHSQTPHLFDDPAQVAAMREAVAKAPPIEMPMLSALSKPLGNANLEPQISFLEDREEKTIFSILLPNRVGLLAKIGSALLLESLRLHHAKILTMGNKVKNLFVVSNQSNDLLTQIQKESLQNRLLEVLGAA